MILVCPIAALPRGEVYRLGTDPPIAVFHTDDSEVYAVGDTCTRQDASLADGWLEGGQVECPPHASRFDPQTGRGDGPPAKPPLRTHRVIVGDGTVSVVPSPEPPGPRPGARAGTAGSAGVEAR
ncbi:bifunctional 3-phenylpropionate/cinnamic acid dioxygenase ferredoxin subunit [Streptosporangium canum]|uniref:bifunctional 3-phenylpropionate/cinnamic acid dioxygenase ferredoxin subunit n=1 Tax=Streptosporangium canum TaxID=324952 RepID=UPI00341ACE68